jgi:hypothetical protein
MATAEYMRQYRAEHHETIKAQARARYAANPVARRESARKQGAKPEVKAKKQATQGKYYQEHREQRLAAEKARHATYRLLHPLPPKLTKEERHQRQLAAQRKCVRARRELHISTVFDHYGRTCVGCDKVLPVEFLTLDHIDSDGAIERKARTNGRRFSGNNYHMLVKSGFPDNLQTMCRNCQQHKLITLEWVGKGVHKDYRISRVAALAALGNKCVCCGEDGFTRLNVDHIFGEGRSENGLRGGKLYRTIARDGNDAGLFQCLCANCNHSKHVHGVCIHQLDLTKPLPYPLRIS